MRLTGIYRETTFSPAHHAQNDRQILELTGEALRRRGCDVALISEEQVGYRPIPSSVIFSMCQGPRANAELEQLEARGALLINSPRAVKNCYRMNLLETLGPQCEGVAPMTAVQTGCHDIRPWTEGGHGPLWIKRGDVHATQKDDVVKVSSQRDYLQVLSDFHRRGVKTAVIQKHIEGMVVKFYGVQGTPFFRFYCEADHRNVPGIFHSAKPAIETLVQRLGLMVYGGDAVITNEDRIVVIDINDWPSFAYFRTEAAEVIGASIYQQACLFLGPPVAVQTQSAMVATYRD